VRFKFFATIVINLKSSETSRRVIWWRVNKIHGIAEQKFDTLTVGIPAVNIC
jgi:hypothetical protein